MSPRFVGGIGPLNPDLMAIGESPGSKENEAGLPFQGPAGGLFDECCEYASIKRSSIYITNVCKYQPPMNQLEKLYLIDVDINKECEKLWEEEISVLKPKAILAIGRTAMAACMGWPLVPGKGDPYSILNYRGSILTARDGVTKVIPTIHPAALFPHDDSPGMEYTYLRLIKHDFLRAVEESRSRELNLPSRELQIARNSLDVSRFFDSYHLLDKASVDIESVNCVPVCVGFAFSPHHGISIPLLSHIGRHKLTDMGEHELDYIWKEIDKQLRRLKIIGQNFKYDEYKLNLIGFHDMKLHSDTLIKTRVIFPELPIKKQHVQVSLWTREPFYKDEGKEAKIGRSFDVDKFFRYNCKDVCTSFEVDLAQEINLQEINSAHNFPEGFFQNYYYNYMMRKHAFYLKMENVGLRIDFAKKKELSKRYTEMAKVVHDKITESVGHEVNVNSYPQLFTLLYKELKFKYMKRNPTSEDTIVRLLGNHAKTQEKKDILTNILEEKRIRTQKSRYINFSPDYDNRCKTTFNISSTETCRSSTGILKKPIRPKKIGLSKHTISKHGRLAKDIRSMFICDEGKVFISADASQAEPRIVAVLCRDWELLKAFDTVDIHRRTAGLIFGYTNSLILTTDIIPVVDTIPKDDPQRFCGKKVRNGGNYYMGKGEFAINFNTDAQKFDIDMQVSEWRAGQMLDLFHLASPKIKEVFHRDIIDCLQSTRTLIDPFGGVREFNGRMDEQLYKEGFANIPQRTVAHLVQGAALAIDDELNGDEAAQFLSEDHDALMMQVPANNWEPYARLMKKHLEKPIDFSTYCSLKRDYVLTIPSAIEFSDTNYANMVKVEI